MKIIQHIEEFQPNDGIGCDAEGLRKIFFEMGFGSFICCRKNLFDPKEYIIRPFDKFDFSQADIHILHYGGAGYPLNYFLEIPGRKFLRFHNITPSYFFENFQAKKAFELSEMKSVFELSSLKNEIELAVCDSDFNSEFLKNYHFRNLKVMPIAKSYIPKEHKAYGGRKIGFIGRFAPNKKIEDLLFLLYFLKKIHPDYTLTLFGKVISAFNDYFLFLKKITSELDLENNVRILENLDDASLEKEFCEIDYFVSMSEHEGFGIPILEAFSFGVPVIAFDSSAVKDTMKGAGFLFTEKKFSLIAELIEYLTNKPNLRKNLVEEQYKVLRYYNDFPFKAIISSFLKIHEN